MDRGAQYLANRLLISEGVFNGVGCLQIGKNTPSAASTITKSITGSGDTYLSKWAGIYGIQTSSEATVARVSVYFVRSINQLRAKSC